MERNVVLDSKVLVGQSEGRGRGNKGEDGARSEEHGAKGRKPEAGTHRTEVVSALLLLHDHNADHLLATDDHKAALCARLDKLGVRIFGWVLFALGVAFLGVLDQLVTQELLCFRADLNTLHHLLTNVSVAHLLRQIGYTRQVIGRAPLDAHLQAHMHP